MPCTEEGTCHRNCQAGEGGIYGLPLRDGGGCRHLGGDGRSCLEKRKSRAEAPLCPALRRTDRRVVNFSAGTLSFHFGAGGRGGLCEPGVQQRLYAGTQSLPGRSRRLPAGGLQRRMAGRDGDDGKVCEEVGEGDYRDEPQHIDACFLKCLQFTQIPLPFFNKICYNGKNHH